MEELKHLSKEDYDELKSLGMMMMWELYPEATGDFEKDVEIPHKKDIDDMMERSSEIHRIWHKFDKWLTKTYGKDLYGAWIRNKFTLSDGKKKTFKYRHFDDKEFSRRLCGFEVIERIENYVKKYCKEINIVYCDDETYSGSIILLIPHPKHGITVMFIPQNTDIQNRFFLYGNHYSNLLKKLEEMKNIYEKDDL